MDQLFWNLYERSGVSHPILLANTIEYMARRLNAPGPNPGRVPYNTAKAPINQSIVTGRGTK